MTYSQVLTAIHSRKTFSSCPSLERIGRLMERLGNPQDQLRCIHVAGTNGKGSVCALVESALRHAGYRVGLFTSPYLVDFRERIQISRQMVSEARLVACYERVMREETALEQAGFEPINEFELVTALCFAVFAAEKVDYAVIEVGLGGRCDATNIIAHPEVCCITPISLDHTTVLGSTVAEIAAEKAGIIKPECPVVLAQQEPEAQEVLLRTAAGRNSPAVQAKPWKIVSYDLTGQRLQNDAQEVFLPLLGKFQSENVAAAWEVCRLLGLDSAAIQSGFSKVVWQARFQYVPGKPALLIDAGHNPAGVEALCETLDELFPSRTIIAVMAMMQDKNYKRCIPMVAGRCNTLIAATVSLPRSLSPEALAAEAVPFCETRTSGSVTEGIGVAKQIAQPGDLILVCGSVYAAGAALETI